MFGNPMFKKFGPSLEPVSEFGGNIYPPPPPIPDILNCIIPWYRSFCGVLIFDNNFYQSVIIQSLFLISSGIGLVRILLLN